MKNHDWMDMALAHEVSLFHLIYLYNYSERESAQIAFRSRNALKLGAILQQTWKLMPNSVEVSQEEGWDTLVCLCEEYCFGELSEQRQTVLN
jgi:hypothetical protein